MISTQFSKQHGHLVELAEAILLASRERGADAAARLTQLRLRLSREVSEHCGAEVEVIKARPGPTSPAQAALIRQYHDDLLRWRHDLIGCNSDWSPRRVFADPAGFAAAFGPILERLRARVRWEEREFYPAVLARAV